MNAVIPIETIQRSILFIRKEKVMLDTDLAVLYGVETMRTFVQLRQMTAGHKALARRLHQLEQKYDKQFSVVFDALRELMQPPDSDKRPIGFIHGDKE